MSTHNNENVSADLDEILSRVRELTGAESDSAVAILLGGGRSSVATWRKRGTLPCNHLLEFAIRRDVSLDWLFRGIGRRRIAVAGEPASWAVREESPDFGARLRQLEETTRRVMALVERRTRRADPLRLGKLRDLAYLAQLTDEQITMILDLLDEAARPGFWLTTEGESL